MELVEQQRLRLLAFRQLLGLGRWQQLEQIIRQQLEQIIKQQLERRKLEHQRQRLEARQQLG